MTKTRTTDLRFPNASRLSHTKANLNAPSVSTAAADDDVVDLGAATRPSRARARDDGSGRCRRCRLPVGREGKGRPRRRKTEATAPKMRAAGAEPGVAVFRAPRLVPGVRRAPRRDARLRRAGPPGPHHGPPDAPARRGGRHRDGRVRRHRCAARRRRRGPHAARRARRGGAFTRAFARSGARPRPGGRPRERRDPPWLTAPSGARPVLRRRRARRTSSPPSTCRRRPERRRVSRRSPVARGAYRRLKA